MLLFKHTGGQLRLVRPWSTPGLFWVKLQVVVGRIQAVAEA